MAVNPASWAFDAVVALLTYMREHAMETGESEWEVGTILNGTYYAYVQGTDGYTYMPFDIMIVDNYIVNGQTLFAVDNGISVSNVSIAFSQRPSIVWRSQGFRVTVDNGFYNYQSGFSAANLGTTFDFGWSSVPTFEYKYPNYSYLSLTNYLSGDSNYKAYTMHNVLNTPASSTGYENYYIDIDPTETYNPVTIYEPIYQFIDDFNTRNPSETINPSDVPTWAELSGETESESNSGCCDCNCTTIYVNADGSLTLQNDVSGDYNLSIDNNADLSLNVSAAAGAFGAGAIVVDPDAVVNITAGAGAFGAGAIVSPDVSISGDLSVGDISGEINLNASDISFDMSAGDVNIDQSGSTVTNNYNTTNNYYGTTEPVEPEQPFTIDYNEILSEDELESILNQETYEIVISTDSDDVISVPDTIPDDVNELILLPSEVVSASSAVVGCGSQIISDLGLTPIYAPLALFSCFCWMIRGGK